MGTDFFSGAVYMTSCQNGLDAHYLCRGHPQEKPQFWPDAFGLRVSGFRVGVQSLGRRVWGASFRVQGLG